MRVINQPPAHIRLELIEAIHAGAPTHPRFPLTAQMRPHRLAVNPHMTGDRRDRPPLPPQCVNLHSLSLCDHLGGAPVLAERLSTPSTQEPHPRSVDPQGGEFQ